MEKLVITGGPPLKGRVKASGAKNAVLPIMAAALLGENTVSVLEEVPNLADVHTLCEVLASLGAFYKYDKDAGKLEIDARDIKETEAKSELVRRMRASFLVMGPILARAGRVKITLPGGCAIGSRPIDLHLKGFEAMGASVVMGHGSIEAVAPRGGLLGTKIYLDFPSVGATENLIMAASIAHGQTVIENPAQEPEIVDLANYLNVMGAKIRGAGTGVIKIEGVKNLTGKSYTIIPDRIEAGTYMVAAAMTAGDVFVENAISEHLKPVIAKLKEAGAKITEHVDGIRVLGEKSLRAFDIKTMPYPGFPTDMQAQFMALAAIADGTSHVTETVFENRFMHVEELRRMGANIRIDGRTATILGVESLSGAFVNATDLRAGAAMVLSGLVADGETTVGEIGHIDRGYDNLVEKLRALGADIRRKTD